ncbi:MAG: BT1926 family outer membrane beta-barrel protein [Bacteroidales bacterium]|nr:BT1926 family outer membrane beta-barrel protein [Bacteroidales bacterium]MDY6444007.1 BT1926 family outer membrane beta-barrel protein [Bacteroidales bacterium]
MNIKRLTTLFLALLVGASLLAQEQVGRVKPVRFSAAVTVGANGYASVGALDGRAALQEMPELSVNWMDKAPAFGVEASLLFCDKWKLDVGGTFNFSYNPGYLGVPGTAGDDGFVIGDVPEYRAVPQDQKVGYLAYIACSYYFRVPKVPALRPYLGIRFSGTYAQNQQKYDELESMGISVGETFQLGASVIAGIDYYLTPNFYIGGGIDLARYIYGVAQYRPQEGLPLLAGDTHNIGAFGAPRLKIGFLF